MKLEDLVEKLEGTLEGDEKIEISGIAGLAEAGEGDISFLANSKYEPQNMNRFLQAPKLQR